MDRQKAALIVVGVEQRELLMPMHNVDGIVDIHCHGAGRGWIAGTVEVDQRVGQADHLAQIWRIFQARHGRLRAEIAATVGQAPTGELESGIGAQMIEIIAILVSAGDREHTRTYDVGDAMADERRVSRIGNNGCELRGDAERLLNGGSSMTPPSEVMRLPSKAAVIFLRWTDGSENGSRVSSVMAGVAASDSAAVGVDTQISVAEQTFTLHPPTNS